MKKILTVGVFDLFHFGHLRLFQNMRKYGDYLIVGVQSTETITKYKPKHKIFYTTAERVEMLKSLKIIDEVAVYDDVDAFIPTLEFDIFAHGPDQIHQGFKNAVEYCKRMQKEVVILPRTGGISSTYIKNIIEDLH